MATIKERYKEKCRTHPISCLVDRFIVSNSWMVAWLDKESAKGQAPYHGMRDRKAPPPSSNSNLVLDQEN